MPLRVAVTGATGFVGRHLSRALHGGGHEVVALLRPGADAALIGAPARVVRLAADRPLGTTVLAGAIEGVDVVVHAATAYGRSAGELPAVEEANVRLPLALLDAAALVGCPRFIHLDTFFSRPGLEHSYLPAYTESKRRFAAAAAASAAAGRLLLLNARLEHVYGPGDAVAKFIPWLIDQLLAPSGPIRLTRGEQRRDFVHVRDVARALVRLAESSPGWPAGLVEVGVGTGQSMRVRDFVELAHRLSGSSTQLAFGAAPEAEREIPDSSADLGRLSQLGWAPSISPEEGLRELLESRRTDRGAARS